MITASQVTDATARILFQAETALPSWVVERIKEALDKEANPLARSHLQFMLENVRLAGCEGLPICQDTGLPIFHVLMGRSLLLDYDLKEAIAEGVRRATEEIPLRPNTVDPITRENSLDNTGPGMPEVILDFIDGESLTITAFPKGAGSENMSLVSMLNPADDPFEFIVNSVRERAANACPPLFLGIGIGGSFDLAARLAKRALLHMHSNPQGLLPGISPGTSPGISHTYSAQEAELLEKLNRLGIGPMGLGGDTTVLGLKILTALCHTASLPVAINFQCWANRSATEVIR